MVRIGDIFCVPLSAGNVAYGQYLFKDKKFGPIIQIFNKFGSIESIDSLQDTKLLFPPIITGVFAAIRAKLWTVIGHITVANVNYPGFVYAYYDYKSGKAISWSFWNGEVMKRLGPTLPENYKMFEYLIVWNPLNVVKRIETGEYPFPYRDLILHNKFRPRI